MALQPPRLDRIKTPDDLKRFTLPELSGIAEELRQFIIRSVAANPGHLGSSLGVVELTVALLYVYSPPEDHIIWDVGHQAYPYKILTGRREAFDTNRRYHGLCGFPLRSESIYDCFGTGHSSTSISAALGMATADRLQGRKNHTVAIIGDGALTGGMAFEALNNGGASNTDLLVILNDNNMSIDPNVGALKEYLLDISTSPRYNHLKDKVWAFLSASPFKRKGLRNFTQNLNQALKGALLKGSNLFEEFGFRYFGPIDGHDAEYLAMILKDLKAIPGPKLLHCITEKGHGYAPATQEQTLWHAPGKFDYETGIRLADKSSEAPRYQDVFGRTLLNLARNNPRIVGITPAMPTGSSLSILMQELPDQAFDVGIAEPHAVTFAAGLAVEGYIPFCVIYSSFIQRAYDQIVHDVALQNLHVIFCLDRAGLVGDDGATHHGVFDLAFLRPIPNLTLCAPADEYEMEAMLRLAATSCGSWVVRYPRGNALGKSALHDTTDLKRGRARVVSDRSNCEAAFLTLGTVYKNALEARTRLENEGLTLAHYDFRFLKPLDETLLRDIASRYRYLFTVEDGVLAGGFGAAILETLQGMGLAQMPQLYRFGIPDLFVPHGTIAQLQHDCGYSPECLAEQVSSILRAKTTPEA